MAVTPCQLQDPTCQGLAANDASCCWLSIILITLIAYWRTKIPKRECCWDSAAPRVCLHLVSVGVDWASLELAVDPLQVCHIQFPLIGQLEHCPHEVLVGVDAFLG